MRQHRTIARKYSPDAKYKEREKESFKLAQKIPAFCWIGLKLRARRSEFSLRKGKRLIFRPVCAIRDCVASAMRKCFAKSNHGAWVVFFCLALVVRILQRQRPISRKHYRIKSIVPQSIKNLFFANVLRVLLYIYIYMYIHHLLRLYVKTLVNICKFNII